MYKIAFHVGTRVLSHRLTHFPPAAPAVWVGALARTNGGGRAKKEREREEGKGMGERGRKVVKEKKKKTVGLGNVRIFPSNIFPHVVTFLLLSFGRVQNGVSFFVSVEGGRYLS